ncbi:MAG: PRK06851 family protein [Clostridiales bacterium]|nr:PRK06851 family protein [Clostridiales bacterium]HBM79407.1 hypothetical protein [Clostridiaceae bacterium]
MSNIGKIRKVFLGGNTSRGFYSFYYNNILPQEEANRIFIIKGGPGIGKSTFMKKIAAQMLMRGYDVEYLQCSSDNNSLDGIVIPEIKVALVDGTSPHIVDPVNPGAVDEIINLGKYWNVSKLEAAKSEIININKRTSRLFNISYSLLKEAKVAYDEWKSYIKEIIDSTRYNELLKTLEDNVFNTAGYNFESKPCYRHLFASAITPQGLKNYIDTLINAGMKSYAVEGEPGSGVKEMIAMIAQDAEKRGLSAELFHCPFEPEYIDMVIIKDINTVILNTSKPLHYNVQKVDGLRIEDRINLNVCIKGELINEYKEDMEDAKKRFYALIAKAIEHLYMAKTAHDAMERYYIPSMDFKKIDLERDGILDRILNYVK